MSKIRVEEQENISKEFLTQTKDIDKGHQQNTETLMLDVKKKETKSKNLHISLKPSIYAELEKTAKANNISINETINILLKKILKVKD